MFCANCGTQTEGDARFCPRCGAAMAENGGQGMAWSQAPVQSRPVMQAPPVQPVVSAPPAAPAKGGRKWLILLLVLVIAAGGFLYYRKYLSAEAKMNQTMQRFVYSLNSYDISGTLSCFDPGYTSLVQGVIGIFGDYDISDLQDVLYDILDEVDDYRYYYGGAGLPTVSYTLGPINQYDSTHADVTVFLRLGSGSSADAATKVLGMVKKNGNWYFTGKGFLW